MEGTTVYQNFKTSKLVFTRNDSYFPLDIRSLILEHIRQSDGDFCDYNAAFSLILSLCQAFILYFVIFLHYPIFSNTNQEGENNIDQHTILILAYMLKSSKQLKLNMILPSHPLLLLC